jgi:D-3-phosphoglycerate dehydrogenase
MTKGKILIVDDLHPAFKESATAMGYEVNDQPLITRAETLAIKSF